MRVNLQDQVRMLDEVPKTMGDEDNSFTLPPLEQSSEQGVFRNWV